MQYLYLSPSVFVFVTICICICHYRYLYLSLSVFELAINCICICHQLYLYLPPTVFVFATNFFSSMTSGQDSKSRIELETRPMRSLNAVVALKTGAGPPNFCGRNNPKNTSKGGRLPAIRREQVIEWQPATRNQHSLLSGSLDRPPDRLLVGISDQLVDYEPISISTADDFPATFALPCLPEKKNVHLVGTLC